MNIFARGSAIREHGNTQLWTRDTDALMDFGILHLSAGQSYVMGEHLEKAVLLVSGDAQIAVNGDSCHARREDCFNFGAYAASADANVSIELYASTDSEFVLIATENDAAFMHKIYTPADIIEERRGQGLMRETGTRVIRTLFDDSTAPQSNLVLGEVIGLPGRWSSYPPHHHPQPEIYYYKTLPDNGFGYAELGDDVYKVHKNDAIYIPAGKTHPHVTAPGYALWYLWVIRHLPGDRYITPTFLSEHLWVMEKDAPMFER